MASPVFHGLAGAGFAYVLAGDARLPLFLSLRRFAPLYGFAAVLACLPDVDYVPGLWLGDLNAMHQLITHSLAWVVLVSAGLWALGRIWMPQRTNWRAAVFILVLVGSHLAIDLATEDHRSPYGIPLWAPFSWTTVRGPAALLPAWNKSSLGDIVQSKNLRPLGIELAAGCAVALGCVAAKRSWTRRRAAL